MYVTVRTTSDVEVKDMKAVLLAGGEGSRLRPISAEVPKPMVRLLDKPVMEYAVELLKKHGFTDIITTLQTLPHKITDYFGDGAAWGVHMRHFIETTPLGTAGGVKACREQLGDEPVLIISGDAVTDFNLRECYEFHVRQNAEATLILHRQEELLDYGLVMAGPDGRVLRFIEKPSWGQVFTNTVNTGIYILNPSVLDDIPDKTFYDFAKDVFPAMLAQKRRLFAYVEENYWCDMGNTQAYLNCCCDALEGKIALSTPLQTEAPGDAQVTQPVYLGREAQLGKGCRIGPYTVLGAGSCVGEGAVVECSVVDGAQIEASARIEGAFVGRGSLVREGACLREGAVVGENVVIGEHAELTGGARVWPNKEIDAGIRVEGSVTSGAARKMASFDGHGTLSGQLKVELTPEFCMRLGSVAASFVRGGEVGLSVQGGEAARMAALAIETGLCAAGGNLLRTDASFTAEASYAARHYKLPLSIFVEQDGERFSLRFVDETGLPIEREVERKLEALTARGESALAGVRDIGKSRTLLGLSELHTQAAARPPVWAQDFKVEPWSGRVTGGDEAGQALRAAMTRAGCTLRGGLETPLFSADGDGQRLSAVDEEGQTLSHERVLACLLWLEARAGVKIAALPYSEPAAFDELAQTLHMTLLRVGRDGPAARTLYASQRFLWDAAFSAARLTYGLKAFGMKLSELHAALPAFHLVTAEIGLAGDRGEVMRALAATQQNAELVEGLRARVGRGWVHVAPLPGRRALRILAEGASEEIASEICDFFLSAAKKIDRQSPSNVI